MAKRKISLADSIREDIKIAENNVASAREKFELWSTRLTDAQQEVARLTKALAALEGTVAPEPSTAPLPAATPKTYPLDVKIPDAAAIVAGRSRSNTQHEELLPESSPVATNKPNRVVFNGEEIDLEPGWRVQKNSFGEDALIPPGMPNLPPMEEPLSVRAPQFSLPAVGANDSFSDPVDLF